MISAQNLKLLLQGSAYTALAVGLFIGNAVRLRHSIRFYRDVSRQIKQRKRKKKKLQMTSATVTGGRRGLRFSTASASAAYEFHGKKTKGKMICAYENPLEINQRIQVIVDRKSGRLFAFSVQQIKDAILTYSVWTAICLCASVFFGFCLIILTERI